MIIEGRIIKNRGGRFIKTHRCPLKKNYCYLRIFKTHRDKKCPHLEKEILGLMVEYEYDEFAVKYDCSLPNSIRFIKEDE